jgi:MHS family proline/betaine transporter-like MFS transporter
LIGRKKTFIIAETASVIGIPLCYLQLTRLGEDSLGWIIFYASTLAFFGKVAYAPLVIFLNERFPTAIRASGTGLNWNIGFAIGGVMPTFVALASPSTEDIPSRLLIFLGAAGLLFLAGSILNPETRGNLDTVTETKEGI